MYFQQDNAHQLVTGWSISQSIKQLLDRVPISCLKSSCCSVGGHGQWGWRVKVGCLAVGRVSDNCGELIVICCDCKLLVLWVRRVSLVTGPSSVYLWVAPLLGRDNIIFQNWSLFSLFYKHDEPQQNTVPIIHALQKIKNGQYVLFSMN